jgi:hypothetical protein
MVVMNEVMHLQIRNICAMIVVDGKSTLAKNTSLPNDVNFILELTFK